MKTQISCDVIGDLYPVYSEGLCSDDTRQLVESHLAECERCRKLYADFQPVQTPATKSPDSADAFRKINRKLRIRKFFAIIGTPLVILILAIAGWFCYVEGYVPIWGKLRAQSRLSAYTGSKIHCHFDFYNAMYVSSGGLRYLLHDDLIVDPKIIERLQTEIEEEYAPLKTSLQNEGFENAELSCDYAAVNGRDFSQEYIKVFWWVWEPVEMTDAEAEKHMAALYERLCEALPDKQITGIQFMYYDYTGSYAAQYPISTEPLSLGQIANGAKRMDENHLPQDYLSWRGKYETAKSNPSPNSTSSVKDDSSEADIAIEQNNVNIFYVEGDNIQRRVYLLGIQDNIFYISQKFRNTAEI